MIGLERDGAPMTIDAPTGQDDYLVIRDGGMIYPLPEEWTVYNTENW